jgi:hypothetical protein
LHSPQSRQTHQTPRQEHPRRRRRRLRMPGARLRSPQSRQTHQMPQQEHLLRDKPCRHRCQPRMVLVQKHARACTVERSFSPVGFFALPRHRVGHTQQDWGGGGGEGRLPNADAAGAGVDAAKALAPPPPNTLLLDPNAEPELVAGIADAPTPPLAAGAPNPPAGPPNAGVDAAPNPVTPPLIPCVCVCVRERRGRRKSAREGLRKRKRVGERERKSKGGRGREGGREGGRQAGREGGVEGGRSLLSREQVRGGVHQLWCACSLSLPFATSTQIKRMYVREHHARARTPDVG